LLVDFDGGSEGVGSWKEGGRIFLVLGVWLRYAAYLGLGFLLEDGLAELAGELERWVVRKRCSKRLRIECGLDRGYGRNHSFFLPRCRSSHLAAFV
jgi:hypothetical protein